MYFDLHICIDYSGRETPKSRTPALQVYASFESEEPRRILSPASSEKTLRNWCRTEIAEWLIHQARTEVSFIAGIDHGFSFPIDYYKRYGIESWPEFLDDFCKHWPTDGDDTYVDFIRCRDDGSPDRTGNSTDLRLTEKWTSSAKSVFELLSRVVCSSLTDNSSGGCFGLLDSIDEGDPLDHIGDPFRTVQSSPSFLG